MLPLPLEDVVAGTETASEIPVCGVKTAGADRTVEASANAPDRYFESMARCGIVTHENV